MKEVSFEENMESLEKVVQELENDELNLEESINSNLEWNFQKNAMNF